MSEHQYYEFRAIDRPLTDRQMRELRVISTRAAISRTSFSNHYEYGDLKANPRDLLAKYFDASLYFAHWMYLEVAFRFQKDAIDVKALRRYTGGHTFDARKMGEDVIVAISVESDGETFDAADDGSDWLSALIGLRTDIANGDQRAPYLAWLLDVQCGVVDDDAPEPARPEGLGALSPALESLVDVIGLDRDFVAVAAEGAPRAIAPPSGRDLHRWVSGLDGREHIALLTRVARGDGSVSAELQRRFRQQAPRQAAALPLRTAGELRVKAEAIARRRLDATHQREARERARREREVRTMRERYLTGLAKRERQAWERVDGLIGTKRRADYAAAVTLLVDLRDITDRNRRDAAFAQRLATIRARHAKKPALLARLAKAGL